MSIDTDPHQQKAASPQIVGGPVIFTLKDPTVGPAPNSIPDFQA